MPITRFLSEPTLRFFMFVLLGKPKLIGYISRWKLPEDTTNWRGPFKFTDIVNDECEADEILRDLKDYGLTKIIRIFNKLGMAWMCSNTYYYRDQLWRNKAISVSEVSVFKKEWADYIVAFKDNKLSSIHNYYRFEDHKIKIFEIFSQYYSQFNKQTFSVKVKSNYCRYFEFLWVLQQDGICVINDIQCQDEGVLGRTGSPVGSVLNITLTETGMKELQNFMKEQTKHKKKKLQESEGPARITRGDWTISLARK